MSKYIDYDAIDYRHYKLHDKSSEFLDGVIYMAERIENASSIDIVQCKKCKYWRKKDGLTYCSRIGYGYGRKPDDFCSYGERE